MTDSTDNSNDSNSNDTPLASFNVTISQQGVGLTSEEVVQGSTLRELLTAKGVDLTSPVMINGAPALLDSVLEADDTVVQSKSGKGATV